MPDVSTLLTATVNGVQESANQLFELLYDELRAMARAQLLRNDHKGLLNTTTLVHESYLRFLKKGDLTPENRAHFLAYASHVMRSVLVDVARRHMANKRGAGQNAAPLNTDIANGLIASDEQLIQLHEALDELTALEPRLGRIVEMRYFGGLQEEEIATILSVSVRTVRRDWEKARMLLGMAMKT